MEQIAHEKRRKSENFQEEAANFELTGIFIYFEANSNVSKYHISIFKWSKVETTRCANEA